MKHDTKRVLGSDSTTAFLKVAVPPSFTGLVCDEQLLVHFKHGC